MRGERERQEQPQRRERRTSVSGFGVFPRDGVNRPASRGSAPLGSAVIFLERGAVFFGSGGFGSQICEVMSRPKPRRCVAVQGPE